MVEECKVHLNEASHAEIEQIWGVDEELAERIIRYRRERGGFDSVEELRKIDGFSEVTFRKIREQTTV